MAVRNTQPSGLVNVSLWYLCARGSALETSFRPVPSVVCGLSTKLVRVQWREGPSVLPGRPLSNPLVTATSEGCSPRQRGCDGQPVKQIVSALAGLAAKANIAAFQKFIHSIGDRTARLPNWACTGFRINVTSGAGPNVVRGTTVPLGLT